jgi:hypothetical protein
MATSCTYTFTRETQRAQAEKNVMMCQHLKSAVAVTALKNARICVLRSIGCQT